MVTQSLEPYCDIFCTMKKKIIRTISVHIFVGMSGKIYSLGSKIEENWPFSE
ncbi:hypothetical protein DsansV1_C38g0236441 [Dioscorea sansibarensis]